MALSVKREGFPRREHPRGRGQMIHTQTPLLSHHARRRLMDRIGMRPGETELSILARFGNAVATAWHAGNCEEHWIAGQLRIAVELDGRLMYAVINPAANGRPPCPVILTVLDAVMVQQQRGLELPGYLMPGEPLVSKRQGRRRR